MDTRQIVQELQAQATSADKLDRERMQLFATMIQTPAWKAYVEFLDKRIQGHADVVMSPAGSLDGAIGLEYIKGAMSGLIMARDLPSVIVTAIRNSLPADDGEE